MLGDGLSRAAHAEPFFPVLHISNVTDFNLARSELLSITHLLENGKLFGSIQNALGGEWPKDPMKKDQVSRSISQYRREEKDFLWHGLKLCITRKYAWNLFELAHDSKYGGHFGYAKTFENLNLFCWSKKSRDVKLYIQGCDICQRSKTSNKAPISNPQFLKTPKRRWGSISAYFIVQLPRTKQGCDAITARVDRLSRGVHFIPCKTTDTAVDVARAFFNMLYRNHGLPEEIISDRDRKFVSLFGKN